MNSRSAHRDDLTAIREFFKQHAVASLRLPDGWFGRPYDNWHQLSDIDLDGATLVITLDASQVLRIRTSDRVVVDGRTLRVPAAEGTWKWTPYGASGEPPRITAIGIGTVEFHAPWADPPRP
jgi:hypothetical protein